MRTPTRGPQCTRRAPGPGLLRATLGCAVSQLNLGFITCQLGDQGQMTCPLWASVLLLCVTAVMRRASGGCCEEEKGSEPNTVPVGLCPAPETPPVEGQGRTPLTEVPHCLKCLRPRRSDRGLCAQGSGICVAASVGVRGGNSRKLGPGEAELLAEKGWKEAQGGGTADVCCPQSWRPKSEIRCQHGQGGPSFRHVPTCDRGWGLPGGSLIRALNPFLRVPPS